MSLKFRLWSIVILIAVLAAASVYVSSGEAPQREVEQTGPIVWRSSLQCKQCHTDVWEEWLGSHHQVAYLNPEVRQLSDDFRDKACQACHLPRPISITGFGKRTLHRNTYPAEGVSCLTCHLNKDGTILGRNDRPDVGCQPKASADLISVELCASCHNQHQTTDQWRASRFAASGTDCNACHMPAQPNRGGRGHLFDAAHSAETLRSGIRFALEREGEGVALALENFGVGHNFPTEERSRAADMVVRFEGAAEESEWKQVHRFRLPYRSEPLPDTTLPAGETERVTVEVPVGTTAVVARLWYRTTPFATDDDPHSLLLFEQRLESPFDAEPLAVAVPNSTSPIFAPRMDLARDLQNATLQAASDEASINAPPLPALELRVMLPGIQELASRIVEPSLDEQERLLDMLEAAFLSGRADQELAGFAKQDLLGEENVRWALEQGLVHEDVGVRSNAAFELGELGQQAAIPALLLRLKYWLEDRKPSASVWAAAALARLGNYAGLPYLVEWMGSADTADSAGLRAIEVLRAAGIDPGESPTFVQLGEQLTALHKDWLRDGFVGESRPTPEPLTTQRMAASLTSLEGFRLRPVDETRFLLTRMGVLAVPLLEDACHAEEAFLRTHVLEILRDLGRPAQSAMKHVLPLLGDELSRADAARALGRLGDLQAAPHLAARLQSSDLELRAACAGALGPLGAQTAIPALEQLRSAESEPMDVRVQAAFSLALLQPEGPARAWLDGLRKAGDYHEATLNVLLEEVDRQSEVR